MRLGIGLGLNILRGSAPISGSVSGVILGDLVLSATGKIIIAGVMAVTLGDLTGVGTGVARAAGTLSATLGDVIASGTGTVKVQGSASPALDAVTSSAAGTVKIQGSASPTLVAVTTNAAGAVIVQGASSLSLAALTLSATGTVTSAGFASWPALIGAEMQINGDCGSSTGWNLNNAVIALGKMGMTSAATGSGATNDGTPASAFIEGATYRIGSTQDSFTLGSLKHFIGTAAGTLINSAGAYTQEIVAIGLGGGDGWFIEAQATTTCSLDNFSVKSVGLLGVEADWTFTGASVYWTASEPAGVQFDGAGAGEKAELTGSAKTLFDAAVSNNTPCSVSLTKPAPDLGDPASVTVALKGGTPVDFTFVNDGSQEVVTHTVTSGSGSGFILAAGSGGPSFKIADVDIALA